MWSSARELYDLLEPLAGQLVTAGALISGSVDRALGTLATTLGRYEQADGHFAAVSSATVATGQPAAKPL